MRDEDSPGIYSNMNHCEEVTAVMDAYCRDKASPEMVLVVEPHIMECSPCAKLLSERVRKLVNEKLTAAIRMSANDRNAA